MFHSFTYAHRRAGYRLSASIIAERSRMSPLFNSCGSAYTMTFCFDDIPSLSYPTPTAVPRGCYACDTTMLRVPGSRSARDTSLVVTLLD